MTKGKLLGLALAMTVSFSGAAWLTQVNAALGFLHGNGRRTTIILREAAR